MGVRSLISIMKAVVALVSVMALTLPSVESHGRLMDPPSRASQWRFGFNNPKDYNDNQGYCGGVMHQNVQMGGKCGICGDPWDGPREHEAPGGRYANGNIVATYRQGQEIDVAVEVTTSHMGHFNYKLCPNNNVHQDPTQDCFDAHPLQLGGGKHGEELPITEWGRRYWNTTVKLPDGLTCSQCILHGHTQLGIAGELSLMELPAWVADHRNISGPALISRFIKNNLHGHRMQRNCQERDVIS